MCERGSDVVLVCMCVCAGVFIPVSLCMCARVGVNSSVCGCVYAGVFIPWCVHTFLVAVYVFVCAWVHVCACVYKNISPLQDVSEVHKSLL